MNVKEDNRLNWKDVIMVKVFSYFKIKRWVENVLLGRFQKYPRVNNKKKKKFIIIKNKRLKLLIKFKKKLSVKIFKSKSEECHFH